MLQQLSKITLSNTISTKILKGIFNQMKILVTGAAGFIGFNFCKYLLSKTEAHKVIGIDNMNNYYDTNLKKMRLKFLKKHKKFRYYKIDINEQNKLEKIFKKS